MIKVRLKYEITQNCKQLLIAHVQDLIFVMHKVKGMWHAMKQK